MTATPPAGFGGRENRMMYRVTLATTDRNNFVTMHTVGTFATMSGAMKNAKRSAGRASKFEKRGEDSCYIGPIGTAWITK